MKRLRSRDCPRFRKCLRFRECPRSRFRLKKKEELPLWVSPLIEGAMSRFRLDFSRRNRNHVERFFVFKR